MLQVKVQSHWPRKEEGDQGATVVAEAPDHMQ